ncbi:MAG: formate dehydrogenase accessory protein FdhE [Desulfotomaculaceae bacterium]|nr:formate dehydrogenase accessory protein FdhE [Desulfotomaculaceae bacterium]
MMKSFAGAPLLDFYMELNKISLSEDAVRFSKPAREVINAEQEQTMPLIKVYPPKVAAVDFFEVLHQVSGVIQKKRPDMSNELAKIEAALPADPTERELFATQAFVPGINLLTNLKQDLPPDTFGLLLNHTVKLFMPRYAQEIKNLRNFDQWLQGKCPVCGGRPSFALLDKEEGKRYLYCGLCEVKWRFNRLICPFCLNNESQFFTVKGMEKYRVYFCDQCHGYIKTIDERRTGEADIDLFWEDIKTMQLDILAINEGYYNQPVEQPATY